MAAEGLKVLAWDVDGLFFRYVAGCRCKFSFSVSRLVYILRVEMASRKRIAYAGIGMFMIVRVISITRL